MVYTRKFNGKAYEYDSIFRSVEKANARVKELRQNGYFSRKTEGHTLVTHSPYWQVWKLKHQAKYTR